jgi:hypothetical protein
MRGGISNNDDQLGRDRSNHLGRSIDNWLH